MQLQATAILFFTYIYIYVCIIFHSVIIEGAVSFCHIRLQFIFQPLNNIHVVDDKRCVELVFLQLCGEYTDQARGLSHSCCYYEAFASLSHCLTLPHPLVFCLCSMLMECHQIWP